MDDHFFEINGKEYCHEERVLAELLKDGVLFANSRQYIELDGQPSATTIVLFVNCSDLFAWGCSDAEPLPHDQIGPLYRMHKAGKWGSDKWCCHRRNQKPQGPVERRMREDGAWDDAMEALPANVDDVELHKALGFALKPGELA